MSCLMRAGTRTNNRILNRERPRNIMKPVGPMIANARLTKYFVSMKMIKEKMSFKSKH